MTNITIPIKVNLTETVFDICDSHPTCDGCCFWEKYKGCYFRGKTPREWTKLKELWKKRK